MVDAAVNVEAVTVTNEEFAELDIRVGEFKEVWKVRHKSHFKISFTCLPTDKHLT